MSVSSSSATNPPGSVGTSEPLQGIVIPMCVYLHNQTALLMEVEDTPTATCEILCQAILNCEEVGLNKQLGSQVFALWMCSSLLGKYYVPQNN